MVSISREEPLGAEDGGQLGLQHLDRDVAVVLEVVGEIHGRHAALAQLALDPVAVGQGGLEPREEFGHFMVYRGKTMVRGKTIVTDTGNGPKLSSSAASSCP